MSIKINILFGDCYSAVYVNGTKVYEHDILGSADFLLNAIFNHLGLDVSIEESSFEDFEEEIWADGEGYLGKWEDIEKLRMD